MTVLQKIYTYSGAVKTFTLPNGVSSLRVELWGATGGGALDGESVDTVSSFDNFSWMSEEEGFVSSAQGSNGAGYVSGTIAVPLGSTGTPQISALYFAVGGNGKTGASRYPAVNSSKAQSSGPGGWPDGGSGGYGYMTPQATGGGGSGGGGSTRCLVASSISNANTLMCAGAAGGAGGTTGPDGGMPTITFTDSPVSPDPPYGPITVRPGGGAQPPYSFKTYYFSAGFGIGGYGGPTARQGGVATSQSGGATSGTAGGGATGSGGGSAGANFTSDGQSAPSAGTAMNGGGGGHVTQASANSSNYIACGGGGGGGGYYGGGGGAAGSSKHGYGSVGAGGGGGSNFISATAVGSVAAPTVPVSVPYAIPPYGQTTGYGGMARITYTQRPNTPNVSSPSTGSLVDGGKDLPITFTFSSPDPAATLSQYRVDHSVDGVTWITGDVQQAVGASATQTYTMPHSYLGSGSLYLRINTLDNNGDDNATSGLGAGYGGMAVVSVTVYTPPPPPVVTVGTPVLDVDGKDVDVPVSWTTPGGSPIQSVVTLADAAGNTITSATFGAGVTSGTVLWPASAGATDDAQAFVAYSIAQVSGQYAYSTNGAANFAVNIDPPGKPVVAMVLDSIAGTITLNITAVNTPYPTMNFEIFRSDPENGEIRIATALTPDQTGKATYVDQAVATDTSYTYRVRAFSTMGGFADCTDGTVAGS